MFLIEWSLSESVFSCLLVYFSKSSAFYLLSPSVHPVVWSSPCIHFSCLVLHWLHHSSAVFHCWSHYHLSAVLFISLCFYYSVPDRYALVILSNVIQPDLPVSLGLCAPTFDFGFCFLYCFDPLPLDPFFFCCCDWTDPKKSVLVSGCFDLTLMLNLSLVYVWRVYYGCDVCTYALCGVRFPVCSV